MDCSFWDKRGYCPSPSDVIMRTGLTTPFVLNLLASYQDLSLPSQSRTKQWMSDATWRPPSCFCQPQWQDERKETARQAASVIDKTAAFQTALQLPMQFPSKVETFLYDIDRENLTLAYFGRSLYGEPCEPFIGRERTRHTGNMPS